MCESDFRDHILLTVSFGCLLCFPVGTTFFSHPYSLVYMVIGFLCLLAKCVFSKALFIGKPHRVHSFIDWFWSDGKQVFVLNQWALQCCILLSCSLLSAYSRDSSRGAVFSHWHWPQGQEMWENGRKMKAFIMHWVLCSISEIIWTSMCHLVESSSLAQGIITYLKLHNCD